MRFFLILLLWLIACDKKQQISYVETSVEDFKVAEASRIKSFSTKAKLFCKKNNYNRHLFFLIDMAVASGRKRFFIYDLDHDSVNASAMVAHGCCRYSFLSEARFSNKIGCGCTSFGKYKIDNKYQGNYGIAYKLIGLDSSNSNVYKRSIVLHSYYAVPDNETYPDAICNSYGCIMISKNFIKQVSNVIDNSSHSVLLWVVK